MHMRIVWGETFPDNGMLLKRPSRRLWKIRGKAKGLNSQYLLRDQNDPDAGYSISHWDSEEDMRAFWDSKQRSDAMAVIQPFFVNHYTITNCESLNRCKPLNRCRKRDAAVSREVAQKLWVKWPAGATAKSLA